MLCSILYRGIGMANMEHGEMESDNWQPGQPVKSIFFFFLQYYIFVTPLFQSKNNNYIPSATRWLWGPLWKGNGRSPTNEIFLWMRGVKWSGPLNDRSYVAITSPDFMAEPDAQGTWVRVGSVRPASCVSKRARVLISDDLSTSDGIARTAGKSRVAAHRSPEIVGPIW